MSKEQRRTHIAGMMHQAGAGRGMRYEATLHRGGHAVAEGLGATALYRCSQLGDRCDVAVFRRIEKCWTHALDVSFVVGKSIRPVVTRHAAATELGRALRQLAHRMRSAAGVACGNAEFVGAVAADARGEVQRALREAAGDVGASAEQVREAAAELEEMADEVTRKKGVRGTALQIGD